MDACPQAEPPGISANDSVAATTTASARELFHSVVCKFGSRFDPLTSRAQLAPLVTDNRMLVLLQPQCKRDNLRNVIACDYHSTVVK